MNIDSNNILRVDLYDCYRQAESISVYKALTVREGLDSDVIAICEDDYKLLHPFAMEAASKIADHAGYIQCANETGLDALTNDCETEDCETPLEEVPESTKLKGESMDPDLKDLILFNIDELASVDLNRYTVVQTYIQEAITHYILMKWYHTVARYDFSRQEEELYNNALSKVRFNSVTNKKRVNIHRKPRPFG